jgi:hypothetical protein
VRKVLATEMSRSLGGLLRAAYTGIVAEWRNAGVRPLGLAVRMRPGEKRGFRWHGHTRLGCAPAPWRTAATRMGAGAPPLDSRYGSRHRVAVLLFDAAQPGQAYRGGTPIGQVDPALMSLIRRLAHSDPSATLGRRRRPYADYGATGRARPGPLPNLIRAHREELRRPPRRARSHGDRRHRQPVRPDPGRPQGAAADGAPDRPAAAAGAARRAGRPSFFSSRRHPVRRSSTASPRWATASRTSAKPGAQTSWPRCGPGAGVVEGDFDQIETYEQKLAALEAFVAEQAREGLQAQAAPPRCCRRRKTSALRQHYAQRLAGDLKDAGRAGLPARLRQPRLEPGAAAAAERRRDRRRSAQRLRQPAASCS